eukprot:c8285_g1_i4.p2 GENE.c8285_g1_i4~~c8285_g1_i4.p2  ORF type:complete len:418 (-),score=96.28 c8285_g1_i4:1024-2277(-)
MPPKATKKHKNKHNKAATAGGIRFIDDDPDWTKKYEELSDDDEAPVVVDAAEVPFYILEDDPPVVQIIDDTGSRPNSASQISRPRSPPRKRAQSPPKNPSSSIQRKRNDSPDPSPPRSTRRNDTPDQSPPRRRRNDSPDQSPPRRKRNDSPDQSPPRRRRNDSTDQSPPRRRRNDSPDQSPPRRRRNDSPDQSPPRKRVTSPPNRVTVKEENDERDEPEKTLSGVTAGLRRSDQLKEEIDRKRKEEANCLAGSNPELSGQRSATVYRDKTGRKKVDAVTEFMKERQEKDDDPDDGKVAWGGGLVQKSERERMRERLQEEKLAPFARYADDERLNSRQRDIVRWGDPMAGLVQQSGPSAPSTKKRCRFTAPPNRFGIGAGHLWDGIDRSNGFEGKVVHRKYEVQNKKLEQYREGCEDM